MCAIHGFCWPDAPAASEMIAAAAHRGPDGAGTWFDGRLTLAHNLLALTDAPEDSSQPWHHLDRYVLVFNGEVYNHHDLRKGLAHKFRTAADTETLAAGLAEAGPDFLRRVDGMFALAFYDRRDRTLLLARDANGARPLYYGHLGGKLAFSSEIKSLLALGFDRVVSREAFRHYYHAGMVAGPLTLFVGIRRLTPGEMVVTRPGGPGTALPNLNRRVAPFAGDRGDVPALLREKLAASTALARPALGRAGLFLSGGLDSGAVLREMAAGHGGPPMTFSTRFAVPHARCHHNDDADAAEFLAGTYRTKHRWIAVTEQTWVDALGPAVLALEEPRQGKSCPAYYAANKALAGYGVRVTLTGDGGDELLAGYKHHAHPLRAGAAAFAPRLDALRAGVRPPADPALRLDPDEQLGYLESWLPAGGLTGDPVNDLLYVESVHTLAEDFLVRNDRLGGAFGMEARFPLMCAPFRDFCRGLPGEWKLPPAGGPGWALSNKPLLRRAYAGLLPERITAKAKTGWRAPTDEWLIGQASHPAAEGPLRALAREALADPVVRELFAITDADVEGRYLNNRDFGGPPKASGKPSAGPGLASQKELFSVLMFAAWFRAFGMRVW